MCTNSYEFCKNSLNDEHKSQLNHQLLEDNSVDTRQSAWKHKLQSLYEIFEDESKKQELNYHVIKAAIELNFTSKVVTELYTDIQSILGKQRLTLDKYTLYYEFKLHNDLPMSSCKSISKIQKSNANIIAKVPNINNINSISFMQEEEITDEEMRTKWQEYITSCRNIIHELQETTRKLSFAQRYIAPIICLCIEKFITAILSIISLGIFLYYLHHKPESKINYYNFFCSKKHTIDNCINELNECVNEAKELINNEPK